MILRLALALTLFVPVTAHAADAYWVTGVPADDVLFLRASPGGAGAITGAIPPGARGVLIEKFGPDGWGYAVYRGMKGWTALRYLSADLSQTPAFPESLICAGTEPFWSVQVRGSEATYADPDGETPLQAAPADAAQNRTGVWLVRLAGGAVDALTIVRDGQCSDGMSDVIYPYTVYATSVRGVLTGCCRTE